MILCSADLEAPCMFNILNMHGVCADLGLPFDQFLKKAETGMGTKLFLRKSTIHSANLLITESWASAWLCLLVHQQLTIKVVLDCRYPRTDEHLLLCTFWN